jgi:hypothetical protein
MKLMMTKRNKYLLTGGLLLVTATPSFALFGIGDVVFDPTSYASLVSQLTTLETQYNMLKNNIVHFSLKQQWQVTLNQLKNANVANMFGETAGMSVALNTNSPSTSTTAWNASAVSMNGNATSYLQSQTLGGARMSQLAMVETSDSVSPDCLTAVGQYRSTRTQNATANSSLTSLQFDDTDSSNSEVQQLNLLNAAEAQKMAEMQSQGALQACLASQMTVANMERRNAAAQDLNTAAFVQEQRSTNDTSAISPSLLYIESSTTRESTAMAPIVLLAQTLPTASSGVNWLYQFTNNLTNLTTQNGGALTQLGLSELAAISLFVLVSMVVNWNTTGMTFRIHHDHLHIGDLTNFLLRLIVCSLLENYWVNAFPGASFGINHLFSYIAQAMVSAFDQNSLDNLLQLLKTAGDNTTMPGLTAPVQILCYFLVQILLGLASAILFLINCSSFILYGVTALFGPIFVPLLMTKTFRAKFFHFLDVLISFAMIRAVAAAFIFVWSGFLNAFIQQTFNGNYSMEMWLANLIPCTMVFIAFIINMLFIPSMTQAIFGGAAGMAGSMGGAIGKVISTAVMAGAA